MILIIVCLGKSTSRHTSYSDFSKIATFGWDKNVPIVIKPVYPDSLATYDLYFAVRHSSKYKYQNLWLFIDYYNNCDSLVKRDTIEYKLADEYGKWYSDGFGSQYQYEELINQQVTSEIAHHIVIWHGMRNDTLTQIQDIGIRLDIKYDN